MFEEKETLFIRRDEFIKRLEWLRKRTNDLYHTIGKVKVWRSGNDEVCDLCEEYFKKLIDQAKTLSIEQIEEELK